jgi:hypothetical protein
MGEQTDITRVSTPAMSILLVSFLAEYLAKQTEIKELVKDYNNLEVIEEFVGPLSSSIVLVRKINKDLPSCVDDRKLKEMAQNCLWLQKIEHIGYAGRSQVVLESRSEEWPYIPMTKGRERCTLMKGCGNSSFYTLASATLTQISKG